MPATILIRADAHDHSPVGLTYEPKNVIQQQVLDRYMDAISWFGERPDYTIDMGDMTEGKHEILDKDTDQLVPQYLSAVKTLALTAPKREYFLINGTPIHTGGHESLLPLVAKALAEYHRQQYNEDIRVTPKTKLNLKINGWFRIQCRHYIGSSIIPHGRATAPLRSQMWQILNAALDSATNDTPVEWPHLMVFAHVHYYMWADNAWGSVVVMPAWKAIGDKYGDEKCDGSVQMGLGKVTVGDTEEDGWTFERKLYQAKVVSRTEER